MTTPRVRVLERHCAVAVRLGSRSEMDKGLWTTMRLYAISNGTAAQVEGRDLVLWTKTLDHARWLAADFRLRIRTPWNKGRRTKRLTAAELAKVNRDVAELLGRPIE